MRSMGLSCPPEEAEGLVRFLADTHSKVRECFVLPARVCLNFRRAVPSEAHALSSLFSRCRWSVNRSSSKAVVEYSKPRSPTCCSWTPSNRCTPPNWAPLMRSVPVWRAAWGSSNKRGWTWKRSLWCYGRRRRALWQHRQRVMASCGRWRRSQGRQSGRVWLSCGPRKCVKCVMMSFARLTVAFLPMSCVVVVVAAGDGGPYCGGA